MVYLYNNVNKTITVATGINRDMTIIEPSKTYSDAASYLADHPDREADVAAIGWR